MHYYLIGCGGIGGWVATSLTKMLPAGDELVLVDGDRFEEKNLDRQLCTKRDIGKPKAAVLRNALKPGARCTVSAQIGYLGAMDKFVFKRNSWVITGVDNHPARAITLNMCDQENCYCVSAANGYEEAEAYFYSPAWAGTNLDPRKYFPELLTDKTDDPLSPPCTGEILESAPQLAMANMCAAAHAMQLLWYWREVHPQLTDVDALNRAPFHISGSASCVRTRAVGEAA